MTPLVPIVLFGWIIVCIGLFANLPSRQAVFASYIGAWMFLPNAHYSFPGIPDFDKSFSASLGVMLGVLTYDAQRFKLFKFQLFDLAPAALCIGPFFTSLSNGLGPYDGVSASVASTAIWLPAYLCGKLYLRTRSDYADLAKIIFWGGLIYMPLCWIEIRVSPQLHRWIYGFMQHSFLQHIRYGGFRPIVFMQHGLMVAFWMGSATILAFWAWRLNRYSLMRGSQGAGIFLLLLLTTVLCKSMNAIMLTLAGIAFFFVLQFKFGKVLALGLLLIPIGWIGLRATGLWSGEYIKAMVSMVDDERAGSLAARMTQEDLFSVKARERVMLGWGGWMRMFPTDENGVRMTRGVDGLWVIMFGKCGLLGLVGYLAILVQGPIYYFCRIPACYLGKQCAITSCLAVIAGLYSIDCLFNAMVNPVFLLSAAGFTNARVEWCENK